MSEEIEFEPGGGLSGTGRWYVNGDLWFEIDELGWAGTTSFIVNRCQISPDDPDGDASDEVRAVFATRQAAVEAIPLFVAEERANEVE